MSASGMITVTLSVPHAVSEVFQHDPQALTRWLADRGVWPVQAHTVRWRIDPVSAAMVATCEVQVAVSHEKGVQR